MKVTIHISHSEGEDLTGVDIEARMLGYEITRRGGFMGQHHMELSREMDAVTLANLLLQAQSASANAA